MIDALLNGWSSYVCRVDINGDSFDEDDMVEGDTHRIIWVFDAKKALLFFSYKYAPILIEHYHKEILKAEKEHIQILRQYTAGECKEQKLISTSIGIYKATFHEVSSRSLITSLTPESSAREVVQCAIRMGIVTKEKLNKSLTSFVLDEKEKGY